VTTPFVVVGGGVTGLAAAWELTMAGHRVLLVEASDRFGGKVYSETVDGFLLEHGPDSFVSYRPGAVQMATDLGLADEVVPSVPPRLVHLRVRGRMEPIPAGMGMVLPTRLGPFARTKILTWPQKLRAAVDLVLPRVLGPQDMSIGALLRRRLGPGVVARFADPLVGGIYGATVDELSVDAVLPVLRTYETERRSLILASVAQGRSAPRPASPGASPFRSMRTGMGSLVDAMVAGLRAQGADLRTGIRAVGLESTAAGAVVQLSDGTRHEALGVVMAGGAASSADLLAEVAPGAAVALRAIPHGSTATVHLGFDADAFDPPPAGHGYLEAGPDPAPITGVTIASGKWPGRAPTGMVLIRAFVPGRVGAAARFGDDALLDVVTAHVSQALGARTAPRLRHLVRWRGAMPTYTVGHLDRVRAVAEALAPHPQLRVAGSALHGVGVPDCLADGRRVGAELAATVTAT